MPLPPNGTPWPPVEMKAITPHLRAWDAWYSGDPVRLADHYGYLGPGVPGYPAPHAAQLRGGIIGGIARWFWGQPVRGQQLTKLHIPIAADLCQAGADLLFAEPPTFSVDTNGGTDSATQDRLNEIGDDTLHGVLAEASEIGAALGGSFLRVSWDKEVVPDRPFLTAVHADAAWPEFRYGRLVAVTFWTRIKTEGRAIWRHVERHELDGQRNGIILHGLYVGSENDLGRAVPLDQQPATDPLAKLVTAGNVISTESPGLATQYVPNQRPQRRWRNDPVGSSLGRSVLDGVEHLMDALDETYSSWMRDIRLGKGRVFIAESMLRDHGPGQGATFDSDQEIFSPINMLQGRESTGMPIQAEQFAIRVQEHSDTSKNLLETILRTAGFSSQTFGMDSDSARASNLTATEVQSRERRSYLTRDRMMRLTSPPVAAIVEKLLAVDKAVFGTNVTPQLPTVHFADSVQESAITLAQTAAALKAAEAASTQTLVKLVHPDWPDDQVQTEVALIKAEQPAMPDPTTFTGFGSDPTQQK